MPKRIKVQLEGRLSLDELEQAYKRSKDPIEKTHYQIIWLLAQGKTTEEVVELTGYSRSWIYELVWGYNKLGLQTMGDQRKKHPGAPRMLNDEQMLHLKDYIAVKRAKGEKVNGTIVAEWMAKKLGRSIPRQRGWEYLRCIQKGKLEGRKPVEKSPKRVRRSTVAKS